MARKSVAKWLKRIEDTFSGPTGVVGESILRLEVRETALFNSLFKTFSGYVRLLDAFVGFYVETLELIGKRRDQKWPDKITVITAFHIPTFWRFRASNIVFWKGYYIDAVGLLRGVLENALSIIALNKGVITAENAFADVPIQRIKNGDTDWQERIRRGIRKTDNKVREALIGNKSGLSSQTRKVLKGMLALMHNSVHRSRINILRHYVPWAMGKRPFPIKPVYDEDLAFLYTNFSSFLAYILTKTLPFLQVQEDEFPEAWWAKWNVLDESFEEYMTDFPEDSRTSYQEFIRKTFGSTGT